MKIAIAIPARFASVRFPKKVLADLCGKPMLQHVYEVATKANAAAEIYILVDSEEVATVARSFCGQVLMTSPECCCGTDRIASALDKIDGDFIVNLQGDEPLLDPKILTDLCRHAKVSSADILTPIFKIIDASDINDPARVKVVVRRDGRALYFSRSPIPFLRGVEQQNWIKHHQFFGHIGVYGYRRSVLENYKNLSPSALELAESLEQLKLLDNGYAIDTIMAASPSIGIDTPEDLERAKLHLKSAKSRLNPS
ncbi:MAG: 3-deoxy-manno-octulosonate cytidylyltransferase [Puniceicoccales bacterium]|jgi:3-deoxy-manno-octulosonate cytidylyltransferase (CMP-KDO synthetase)|nr:3-deoxy-manno-octulosonate cytidylyltransferase [Puniceicoccales bacterium]